MWLGWPEVRWVLAYIGDYVEGCRIGLAESWLLRRGVLANISVARDLAVEPAMFATSSYPVQWTGR